MDNTLASGLAAERKQILRFAQDDKRFAEDDKRFAEDDKRFAEDDKRFAQDDMVSGRTAATGQVGLMVPSA